MRTDVKNNKRLMERREWISAGAPILVLVLVVAMLFFALIANFAQRQDRAFADDSRHLVQSMLLSRGDALSRLTLDYATWDDAYENVTLSWNLAWLSENYYTAVADALLVVRADGTVRHEWRTEELDISDALIAQAVRASRTDFALPNTAAVDTSDLAAQSMISQDGRLAQISLAVIGPETPEQRRARGADPVDYLIIIDVISAEDIAELGRTIGLEQLAFANDAPLPNDAVMLDLRTPSGRDIGALTWTHERPGSATFALQFWPIMLCLALIGVLAAVVTRLLVDGHVRFAARAESALESSRLRTEFITTMSHELRTPLNAIIGYTELIQEQLDLANESDGMRTDADRILAAAKHLRQLVTDILDHARIDAGKLQFEIEPVNVEGMLKEIVEISEPLALAQNDVLTITASGKDLTVLADDTRLRQILLNLVGNAIKFTRNGEVEIAAELRHTQTGAHVEFRVRDSGIGIAPEELAVLFQPFVQANTDIQKKYGGTGLGLSISQKLAHAMNGSISANSTPGRGSEFTLSLPRASAQQREAA